MAKAKLRKFDPWLFSAMTALILLSLLLLYHFHAQGQGGIPLLFQRQLIYTVVGFGLFWAAAAMSPGMHFALAYILYIAACLILLGVFVWGSIAKGAVRWIDLGLFTFQPAEPAKIALILALARLVTDKKFDLQKPTHLLRAVGLTMLPLTLVFIQPDLGTSIVFASLFFLMMLVAGIPCSYLLILISPVLAAITSFHAATFLIFMILLVVLAWRMKLYLGMMVLLVLGNLAISAATPHLWNQLKPYQQKRLITFINPEADPKGSGYQVIQSKVAVGSGGILGKGLGKGSQTQLKFLPEQHTDFIFAMLAEETGLIGATAAVILYGILIWRGFRIAMQTGGRYTSLVCAGLSSLIAVHVFINIGMSLGLMPVTGLPLPFLSYGGSFLWTAMISAGLILGAQLRWGDYTP